MFTLAHALTYPMSYFTLFHVYYINKNFTHRRFFNFIIVLAEKQRLTKLWHMHMSQRAFTAITNKNSFYFLS